jgi:hypothetical protein
MLQPTTQRHESLPRSLRSLATTDQDRLGSPDPWLRLTLPDEAGFAQLSSTNVRAAPMFMHNTASRSAIWLLMPIGSAVFAPLHHESCSLVKAPMHLRIPRLMKHTIQCCYATEYQRVTLCSSTVFRSSVVSRALTSPQHQCLCGSTIICTM